MAFQDDKFGHKAYDYKPTFEHDVERSPDRRPADGGWGVYEFDNEKVVGVLKVRGLGALVFTGDSTLIYGVAIFTDEQLQFTDASLDAKL